MAKKPELENPFAKTGKGTTGEEDKKDLVRARGIGIKESEWAHLEEIAAELNSNSHALVVWAIRDFIKRYDAGELPIQKRPTLPGL